MQARDDATVARFVRQNRERYEPYAFVANARESRIHPPVRIEVPDSTLEQARWVARCLSSWFPGSDEFYVVEGDDDGA